MCFGNVEKLYEIKFIPTEQKNIALLDNCCKINNTFLKNDLLRSIYQLSIFLFSPLVIYTFFIE